jgi:hypothetical protein
MLHPNPQVASAAREASAAAEAAAAEAAALQSALDEARTATGGEAAGWRARAEQVEQEMAELRERVRAGGYPPGLSSGCFLLLFTVETN